MRELPVEAGAEDTGGPGGGQTPTEATNPATLRIDRADPEEIVRLLLAEETAVPAAVARESAAIARLVEEVAERLRRGGRLLYAGAGTSGRLGALDAAECPPTFGTDPGTVRAIVAGGGAALERSVEGAEDDEAGGRAAIREAGVGPDDFVLGIAASGTTPFVAAALAEARARGARTGLLSCAVPPAAVRALADVRVTIGVGPEAIAGSTRLKAGTATKLVLNAVTTGVMIRLGKVHGNLMVDLRASSRKLVERSLRMLGAVCGLEREAARALLVAAGGSVKTAIAMHELRTSRALAERALDSRAGFLHETLEAYRGGPPPGFYGFYPPVPAAGDTEATLRRLASAPDRMRGALEEAGELGASDGASAARAGAGGRPDGEAGGAPAPGRRGGRWTASQHLAHLIEFETAAVRPRLRAFASADGGASEAEPRFADWEPSPEPPLGDRDPETLLERFARERRDTLAAVRAAGSGLWPRRGALGSETLTPYRLLRAVAQHDEAHAARLRERLHPSLLRAASPESGP